LLRNKNESIIVCAVARDVSSTIRQDFHRINKSLDRFHQIFWLVVESDSSDNSVETLESLKEEFSNFNYLTLGKLRDEFNLRTEILAFARNTYLSEIINNKIYKNVDYVAIADLNNLNNKLSARSVNSALDLQVTAMLTANQKGPYYDIWALRHHLWSPNDCWEQLEFFRKYTFKPNSTLNASVNLRMMRIRTDSEPIEVDSAFGGFAILPKSFIVDDSMYEGTNQNGREICEHVSFCRKIRESGGHILVVPSLINTSFTDHSFRSTKIYSIYRNLGYPIKLIRNLLK
jgi:hypothetical protein